MNSLDVLDILNLIGIAHAMLLAAALLFLRRGNRQANMLLAALMALIALLVTGGVLTHTRTVLLYPHLGQLHIPFRFLAPPLLLIYVNTLVAGKLGVHRRTLLHAVPFGLCIIYLLPFYAQPAEAKLAYLSNVLDTFPPDWYVRTAIGFGLDACYIAAAIRVVWRNTGSPRSLSQMYKGDGLLVAVLLAAFTVIWCGGVARFLFAFRLETNLAVPLALSLTSYVVCFLALVRPQILGTPDAKAAPVRRYEGSTLTPELSERHLKRLIDHMENERPYRDGSLTLPRLARRLAISAPHLSQVINEQLGQSFVDFINQYRIEDAKRSLVDPATRHESILAIAENAGFNSKSAFNAAFKKHSDQTPSEFRHQQLAEQA